MAIDVYKGMNEPQREAIAHLKGPLLVVAGAGSGKTRVITHRIANIIQHGTTPDRVLAITFTNKAAKEMQERVHKLMHLQTPWITTFHSAGNRIMKMERAAFGFTNEFTIMDADDQLKLWRECLKELGVDPKLIDPRKVQWTISRWKNDLVDIANQPCVDDIETEARKAHAVYERKCREANLVDFDDLLVRPVRLLESDEGFRKRWTERFPYILIDEYQDTNKAQYRFFRLFGSHGNICATGDPDQAIYGWRGADITNILSFEKDFPGCKKVLLEQNYRSTKIILRAAQGVVSNNTQREDKTIRTDNPEGKTLSLLAVDDELDESYAVAAALERMHDVGRPYADFAVFYRTNAQSRILEDGLRRRGIPYRIVGGTRFYDRAEVKDLLAYLKLLINPSDRVSLARLANVPKRGLGDATLDLLLRLADEELVPPAEVLERDELLERVAVGRAARPLQELARTWRILRRLPRGDPAALVRAVLEHVPLEEHYKRTEEEAKAQDQIANLREVITGAEQYQETYPEGGVSGFLDLVALNTEAGAREERAGEHDRVTLMTLHAAKGLEFPVVFITACEENIFPLARA
ncbi:MAG: UvrD-helicase domain-containing protein, partial [Planctomycetes bacterium]|nr:UvrD-helicase domain-containing protein [Planctomycetota bacterium]